MSSSDNFIDLSKYEIKSTIGKGSFGVVYRFKEKETEHDFAAKVSLQEFSQSNIEDESMLLLYREIKIMSALDQLSSADHRERSRIRRKKAILCWEEFNPRNPWFSSQFTAWHQVFEKVRCKRL